MPKGADLEAIVTGGAGFIGSHLCAALLERGFTVTCIDNFATGARRNIAPLLEHPRFTLIEHDVVLPLDTKLQPDLIFHLASPASVTDYLSLPLQTLKVNSIGTLNLLELAREVNCRFLFASTSEVYGDPLVHPQSEAYWGNVNPNGPRACYDESKRCGEAATLDFWRTYQTDVRIVRIFNTYGPHSRPDDGRIVPNFLTQALKNEPLTIYGDGAQTRSYCYVSDLVAGLCAAMFRSGTSGEVFNLGNPEEHTVLEFAQIVSRQVGSDGSLTYHPLPSDDPTRRCPDIRKARTVLNWEPVIDLPTGIERTVEWFRQVLPELSAVS